MKILHTQVTFRMPISRIVAKKRCQKVLDSAVCAVRPAVCEILSLMMIMMKDPQTAIIELALVQTFIKPPAPITSADDIMPTIIRAITSGRCVKNGWPT